ncbi:hypothetical protein L218DRAFT_1000361 [Marasmius fiardii PR-910]|nr:hypothetical protein L218DRAFT_1000361 [Marasmius fiardii PR-910]
MAFVGASVVSVEGDIANIVHGNQTIIYNTRITQRKGKEKELTLYDEFRKIKLGDIWILRDICHRDVYDWYWESDEFKRGRLRHEETTSIAKICCKALKDSKFTVVSYNGPHASEKWDEDFCRFSRVRDTKTMQLFGINHSSVSRLLIFHGELLPLSHWCVDRVSMYYYISGLMDKLKCGPGKIWLDTQTGVLCSGMSGPGLNSTSAILAIRRHTYEETFDEKALPSSAELLEEDVYICYLSTLPLDKRVDDRLLAILDSHETESQNTVGFSSSNANIIIFREYLAWELEMSFGGFKGDSMCNGTTR